MLHLLLLPTAMAMPATELWLGTDHVAVGLSSDGSLGNEDIGLGLVFDPDGTDGPYPQGGDVLTPGRTFDAWAVQADQGSWTMAAPDSAPDLALAWDDKRDDGWLAWARGSADADAFTVDLWVVAPWGSPVLWTVVELTAREELTGLWLGRSYDPDVDAPLTGTYSTSNQVLDGVVVASGAVDGRAWALSATGGQGGICDWCALPSEILAGSSTSTADDQLGIAVEVGDLAEGETVRLLFAYGFGTDADAAVLTAEDAAASTDLDGDGSDWTEDCDDLDIWIFPGAEEVEDNGIDDDCDGEVDESEASDTGFDEREDWDEPVPEDDGGSDEDGGAQGDGGSTADGGATESDGGSSETADGDDDDKGGCSTLPLSTSLLGLLLTPAILRRRTQ